MDYSDNPSSDVIKTSQVKFARLQSIRNLIMPFIDYSISVNRKSNIKL